MVTRLTMPTRRVLELLLKSDRVYGLEIIDALGIGAGTLYPMLARLEQIGWLESSWEEVDPSETGRPARRYYRLTSNGRVEAAERLSAGTSTNNPGLAEA